MGHLPARLLQMPSVHTVNSWYGTSLTELHSFKTLQPTSDVVQKFVRSLRKCSSPSSISIRFTEVLQNIRKRHTKVVETLAQVEPRHDVS